MEILLLFVLFSLREDPAFKQKLREFLAFYRENRALFSALRKSEESPEKEESRPAGDGDILTEYLSRLL